jgi:hypothetical protein
MKTSKHLKDNPFFHGNIFIVYNPFSVKSIRRGVGEGKGMKILKNLKSKDVKKPNMDKKAGLDELLRFLGGMEAQEAKHTATASATSPAPPPPLLPVAPSNISSDPPQPTPCSGAVSIYREKSALTNASCFVISQEFQDGFRQKVYVNDCNIPQFISLIISLLIQPLQ